MPLTDFSSSFDNPRHADVLLHLSTSVQVPEKSTLVECSDGKGQQPEAAASSSAADSQHITPGVIVRTYHLHSLILVNHSHYFEGRLGPAWPQSDSRKRKRGEGESNAAVAEGTLQLTEGTGRAPGGAQGTGNGHGDSLNSSNGSDSCNNMTKMTELVEEAELEAMHELLKLMYSQKVPSHASADLILQCLRLADRYQAAHCTELLIAHLAANGKDIMTYSIAVQLYGMPGGLHEQEAFKGLLGISKQLLVAHFRNVPAVVQDDSLRQQFCHMPFAAVLAWAQSDQLQVHSENCVVYLLSAWAAAQKKDGQSVTAEQSEQLAHQVRVLHLGPAYQFCMLPNMEWFKGCSGMAHLPTLLSYKGVSAQGVPVYPAPSWCKGDKAMWVWEGPAAWVAGSRLRVSAIDSGVSVSWELGPTELQQLHDGKWPSSTAVYANGFMLLGELGREDKHGPGSVTLGMYSQIDAELMAQHGVPWIKLSSMSVSRIAFKVSAPTAADARAKAFKCVRHVSGGGGWGSPNFLGKSAPSVQQLVAPLLIGGKLRAEITFSGVDVLPA